MKSISARVLAVVAVLSLIGNVLMYLRYSTARPLATVGGSVITKKQYQDQLEHQAGKAVLSKMVLDTLVSQAAAREGVTPAPRDVDERLAAIERRTPEVLAPYHQDPAKMAQLRQDILSDIALENLRIKNVALTPSEIAAYYAGHQAEFRVPHQVKATAVVTQNIVDSQTAADLLRQKTPEDVIARQPRLNVIGVNGYNPDLSTLSPAVKRQISAFESRAKAGTVKTFREGKLFLTLEVTQNDPAMTLPLTKIHDQVERLARLERAPAAQAELAHLYQTAKPTFSSEKYAAYFEALQHTP